jgi:hypothetical protein
MREGDVTTTADRLEAWAAHVTSRKAKGLALMLAQTVRVLEQRECRHMEPDPPCDRCAVLTAAAKMVKELER